MCFYWFGERYQKRNFLQLKEGEAKLVQIVTDPLMRGKGVAQTLIAMSSLDMQRRGFSRLFARIWHSNTPSLRAFERAGWMRKGLIIEIDPLHRSKPWRFRIGVGR